VRYIATPGSNDDVLAATGRKQKPFVYGLLPGQDFYFAAPLMKLFRDQTKIV